MGRNVHFHAAQQDMESLIQSDRDCNRTEAVIIADFKQDGGKQVIGSGVAERRPGDKRDRWLGEQLAVIRAHRDVVMNLGRMLMQRYPQHVELAGFTAEEIKLLRQEVSEAEAHMRAAHDGMMASLGNLMGYAVTTPEADLASVEEKDDGD